MALNAICDDAPRPGSRGVSDGVLVVPPLPKRALVVLHVQSLEEFPSGVAYAPGVHDEVGIENVGGGGELREEDAAASRRGLQGSHRQGSARGGQQAHFCATRAVT